MNPSDLNAIQFGGLLILGVALVLGLGGIALVLYSAKLTRDAVVKRFDLIRPSAGTLTLTTRAAPALIRSNLRGSEERELHELTRLMHRFGVSAERAPAAMTMVRMVLIVVLALIGFFAAGHLMPAAAPKILPTLIATALAIVGWYIPTVIVRKGVSARAKAVVAGLPDALELLVICVEAGLSFEDGVDRVAGVLLKSRPALAEELAVTSADLKILPSRELALANFAGRVDMPSIRSVVTTLSQTLRYGTPLAQGLRVVSAELRNDTLVHLEERANQLPTLMTIPMMLFIMPTIFMIVIGPAALNVIDAFKN
jgi:tight adherence protein C